MVLLSQNIIFVNFVKEITWNNVSKIICRNSGHPNHDDPPYKCISDVIGELKLHVSLFCGIFLDLFSPKIVALDFYPSPNRFIS